MEIMKFRPQLKQVLWGGNKIIPFKQLNDNLSMVGESWEISGVKGSESIVTNGKYAGKQLNELTKLLKSKLLGKQNYERFGDEFPLLIKFIDASKQLSVQVHPNDEQAQARGLKRGKTEMWYIMNSEENASLYCGLKKRITPDEYKTMVNDGSITEALREYKVKEGDVFFLPPGRIHSIGSGCFLAEIQQTSDITYRIYDFKRKDKKGNYRQLHTEEAAECINFTVEDDYRTNYEPIKEQRTELTSCPYFTVSVYDLSQPMDLDYSQLDSFVILIGLKGKGHIINDEQQQISFREGESILLPATATKLQIKGEIKFLETYI